MARRAEARGPVVAGTDQDVTSRGNGGQTMPRRKLPRDVDAEPALRTVEETAVLLGVSVAQIYRLARRGELDMLKIGRSTRVTQDEPRQLYRERQAEMNLALLAT